MAPVQVGDETDMPIKVTVEGVRSMVEEHLKRFGLSTDRFIELGRADELDEPELRDLWLIWGTEIDLVE